MPQFASLSLRLNGVGKTFDNACLNLRTTFWVLLSADWGDMSVVSGDRRSVFKKFRWMGCVVLALYRGGICSGGGLVIWRRGCVVCESGCVGGCVGRGWSVRARLGTGGCIGGADSEPSSWRSPLATSSGRLKNISSSSSEAKRFSAWAWDEQPVKRS